MPRNVELHQRLATDTTGAQCPLNIMHGATISECVGPICVSTIHTQPDPWACFITNFFSSQKEVAWVMANRQHSCDTHAGSFLPYMSQQPTNTTKPHTNRHHHQTTKQPSTNTPYRTTTAARSSSKLTSHRSIRHATVKHRDYALRVSLSLQCKRPTNSKEWGPTLGSASVAPDELPTMVNWL